MIVYQNVLQVLSIAAFTVAAIAVNVYRNKNTYEAGQGDPHSKQWHGWQGLLFAAFFFNCGRENWHIALPGWVAFWILFDGFNNLLTFENRDFFFVGNTAWIDKQFQKFKDPPLWSGLAKAILLTATVVTAVIF